MPPPAQPAPADMRPEDLAEAQDDDLAASLVEMLSQDTNRQAVEIAILERNLSKQTPRWETPEYHAARAEADQMAVADLEAEVEAMKIKLAVYGDALASRRRKIDPAKLAASYGAIAARR